MNTPVKDYVPFGEEWKAYLKQMKKDDIIKLFADSCTFKDGRIEELLNASWKLIHAMDQYSFFSEGYRDGSASIAEVNRASDELNEAKSNLFHTLKGKL